MSDPQEFEWIGGLQGSDRVRVDQIVAYRYDYDNGTARVYKITTCGGDRLEIRVPLDPVNPIEPSWNPRR
jgi:hypothetical protein